MSARLIRARMQAIRERGADAGITLMELLVAMVLNSIIGALTLILFVAVDDSSGASTDRAVNTASARNAIQSWTAYLRVADGTTPGVITNRFEWLTSNDILFYADLFNRTATDAGVPAVQPPTMMWLRRDSKGALVEEQFPYNAIAGQAPSQCRTLVPSVSTTAGALFTPFDSSGTPLTTGSLGTAPASSAGCRALPVTVPSQTKHPDGTVVTNLQNVAAVSIDFVVRDTKNKHPLEFSSQAVLPAVWGG